MGNNAIVGQSGGPTSVINASLAGVFQACVMRGANRVYGMLNGVAGLLDERVKGFTRNANGHPNFEYCTIAE